MDLKNSDLSKNLVIIAGPTAVGKTSFGIKIASHFNTEIISADSRQFYHELKIGTAAPEPSELSTVKHHFIGHISIHDYYNVAMFESQALETIHQIFCSKNIAVMLGGSGLYINVVCSGIDELPDPDIELRRELKETYQTAGIAEIRNMLKKLDPEYYSLVDLANPNRILRALEICITTGQKYSSLRKNPSKKREFNIIKIGLERERTELFNRINRRVDEMFSQGLLEEARQLYEYKHLNALNTVGYKELFDFLDKKMSFEEAVEKIKTNSRRYAKRQLTWFKKDPHYRWFHPEELDEAVEYIRGSIKND